MNLFKKKTYRSEKYLKFVKEQPCLVTGYPVSDPHHIKGHGMTGGAKGPDWAVIPLSRETHSRLHSEGYKQWEANNGSQIDHLFQFWRDNFDEIMEIIGDDFK